MKSDQCEELDEVRVISLPPPQTAAVNRLLREEQGWVLLDVRVGERVAYSSVGEPAQVEPVVHYVMGHRRAPEGSSQSVNATNRED